MDTHTHTHVFPFIYYSISTCVYIYYTCVLLCVSSLGWAEGATYMPAVSSINFVDFYDFFSCTFMHLYVHTFPMYMRIFHPFAPRFFTMSPLKDETSTSGRLDVSEKLRIDRTPVLHSTYISQFILIFVSEAILSSQGSNSLRKTWIRFGHIFR